MPVEQWLGSRYVARQFPSIVRSSPMLFTFLLVVHALITLALVGVILVQRSEGGGLGMGGSPTGLMSARGAADFLTRATTVLATIFIVLSITIAALASVSNRSGTIDTSLARQPTQQSAPQQPVPASDDPLAAAAQSAGGAGNGNAAEPANGAAPAQ